MFIVLCIAKYQILFIYLQYEISYVRNLHNKMRKAIKYLFITLIAIVCLLTTAIVLCRTIFKDELINYLTKLQSEEMTTYFVADIPVEPENFAEDFESIHKQVVEHCSLYKQKNYDIDSLYITFANRIGHDVQTKSDYALLVCEYFAALNIGHAWTTLYAYSAGQRLEVVEDRLFISEPNEYLSNCGFCDKDEIVGINQLTIDEYVNQLKKYLPASTEAARIYNTRRWALIDSFVDSLLVCDVVRDGERFSIEVPLMRKNEIKQQQPDLAASGKMLNDSVGYINITSMMGNVVEDFKQAYEQVCDLPYLIVDVRNNGGGNSGNGRQIAEYLLCKEQAHCVGGQITPQPNAYQGKLFLLTSPYTFSASESFALDIKESGLATLVGEATGGDTGCRPETFTSKYGICFRIPTREPQLSPRGFPMEGVGIEPHITIGQTVEDYFADKDTVIEYILNELIKN